MSVVSSFTPQEEAVLDSVLKLSPGQKMPRITLLGRRVGLGVGVGVGDGVGDGVGNGVGVGVGVGVDDVVGVGEGDGFFLCPDDDSVFAIGPTITLYGEATSGE